MSDPIIHHKEELIMQVRYAETRPVQMKKERSTSAKIMSFCRKKLLYKMCGLGSRIA